MNRHDIRLLQAVQGYPAVTITLPTHRTSPDNKQDPIRIKNLVDQVTDRLQKEFPRRDLARLLNRLVKLVGEIDYRHTLDGLAIFANKDFARAFQVPFKLRERLVIDQTFKVRDLLFALHRTPRYWVLALSEKPTRLYEGMR